ncbi:MAG: IS4 family transposase [Cyanobacteria bacterium J06635_10]
MISSTVPRRVQILKKKFSNSIGLPFKELLPETVITEIIDDLKIKYRSRLFDPIVTLWAFLSQILDADKSCHNAVSRVISYLVGEGVEIPSTDTSAYCQARQRLPEKLIEKLFYEVGISLEEKVNEQNLWCGRNIKVIDGSNVSMPDTKENQSSYPQHKNQKDGCGFPIAKIGVIFSIATGAAIGLVIDVFNTHDIQLARKLYQFLKPGDVLLGDRAFCAYADLIKIKNFGCDGLFRKHQSRKTQMRGGKIVGNCDKLVKWYKPKRCPQGLTKEEFNVLPTTLIVREIYFYIAIPGFRTKQVSLITTLVDSQEYSTVDIVKLYGERWDVEVNFKHLKTTLGMDILRGKTPSLVRKEIWTFLLAYNLLRTLMFEATTSYGNSHNHLSLQGTRHHFNNFIPKLINTSNQTHNIVYQTLLNIIIHKEVPQRPCRYEPRVKKRRSKAYPLMQKTRRQYHVDLKSV